MFELLRDIVGLLLLFVTSYVYFILFAATLVR